MGIDEFHKFDSNITWVVLILLQFIICSAYSFPNQIFSSPYESDHDSSVYFDKHSMHLLPCFERYVVEPYFRQHYDVSDLNFQDYIKHVAASSSDETVSRLLVLERHLIGEGSHRLLSSSIKFNVQPDSPADFSSQMCEVIIIERLPSGVFADPFELDHILQRGVFKDASVFGDKNLELPAFLSNRSIVEIQLDAALNISSEKEIGKEFKVQIPLHARYPPLEESGYSTVKFSAPDLFFRCKMPEDARSPQICLPTPISGNDGLKANDVKWSIPAGIDDPAGIISVVTFTAALLSAILISVASFKLVSMEPDSGLNQSRHSNYAFIKGLVYMEGFGGKGNRRAAASLVWIVRRE